VCTNSLGYCLNVDDSAPVVVSYCIVNAQLARSLKRKSCSHSSPMRNAFSAVIVRSEKLNTEGVM